ncbi:hypothetical protein BARVI_02485 [Barnesiella viscericola DSM 18177]|uniref:Uncharacterized protein n=1 Tax=Barnesiella viscericola DSM 18177 TaxID=880074 RepID=W0ES65_9BACT|nr:hypothetical protein BARVI_02485 [Barnesiella viscericola DSM 18177]
MKLMLIKDVMLYLISQRYKFESESQPAALLAVPSNAVFNKSKIVKGESSGKRKRCFQV